MINKYSLYFAEPQLEHSFQKEAMDQIRKFIFYAFTTFILFYGAYCIIVLSGINITLSALNYLLAGHAIISIIIGCKRLELAQILLSIGNILMQANIFWVFYLGIEDASFKQVFLIGQNLMMLQSSLLSVLDFPYMSSQLVARLMLCAWLGYINENDKKAFLMIICFTLFQILLTLYSIQLYTVLIVTDRLEYIDSNIFPNSIKSNGVSNKLNLDNLLNILISQSFVYFQFDPVQFKFELSRSNFLADQEEFNQFLRQNIVRKQQTLEQYCFYNQQKEIMKEITENQIFIVNNNKQKQNIKMIQFFTQHPSFIIILQNEFHEQNNNQSTTYYNKYKRIIYQLVNQLNDVCIHKKINKIPAIRLQLIVSFMMYMKNQYRTIDIKKAIQTILKLSKRRNSSLQLMTDSNDFKTVTIQPLFNLMIIQILNSYHHSPLKITLIVKSRIANEVIIKFTGQLQNKITLTKFQILIKEQKLAKQRALDILQICLNQDFAMNNNI